MQRAVPPRRVSVTVTFARGRSSQDGPSSSSDAQPYVFVTAINQQFTLSIEMTLQLNLASYLLINLFISHTQFLVLGN